MKKAGEKKYAISFKLSSKELQDFQKLLQNNEIHELYFLRFQHDFLDKETRQLLEKYKNLKTLSIHLNATVLEILDSSDTEIISVLKSILQQNTLERLEIYLISNQDKNKPIFKAIEEFKSYKKLLIHHRFEIEELTFLQNIINDNPTLTSLTLQTNPKNKPSNFSQFHNCLKDNYNITSVCLPQSIVLNDLLFLSKFKALQSLTIHTVEEENIKNSQNFQFLSNSRIKSIDLYGSKIRNETTNLLMKRLLEAPKIEEICLNYISLIKEENESYEWLEILKEILINKKLKSLSLTNLQLNEEKFAVLIEGLEKNQSLNTLDFSGNNLKIHSNDLGKILKSKDTLKDIHIEFSDLNAYDFLKEFQNIRNLETLLISIGEMDEEMNEEIDILLSNLISNNTHLLDLILEEVKTPFKHLYKSLESHKRINHLFLDNEYFIDGKDIINFIKNNTIMKSLTIQKIVLKEEEFIDFGKIISENQSLKTLVIFEVDNFEKISDKLIRIIEEYLWFNFNLKKFYIDEYESIYQDRNKNFIKNFYCIKDLDFNIFFQFH